MKKVSLVLLFVLLLGSTAMGVEPAKDVIVIRKAVQGTIEEPLMLEYPSSGTVGITTATPYVTGVGVTTSWSDSVKMGWFIRVGRTGTSTYKIKKVISDSKLELYLPFAEATAVESVYVIYEAPSTQRIIIDNFDSDTLYIGLLSKLGANGLVTSGYRLLAGDEPLVLDVDLNAVDLWISASAGDSVTIQALLELKY